VKVGVGVSVLVGVSVGVTVAVKVAVKVGVLVGVSDGVKVKVGVGVRDGVSVQSVAVSVRPASKVAVSATSVFASAAMSACAACV
jgi:hypothetical protein